MKYYLIFLSFFFSFFFSFEETSLEILNEVDEDIDIYWVDISDPLTTNLLLLSTLTSQSKQHFNSYYRHQFVFSYNKDKITRGRVSFIKGEENESIIITKNNENQLIIEKDILFNSQSTSSSLISLSSKNSNGNKREIEKEFYGVRTRGEPKQEAEKIPLLIQNDCPYPIEVFWVDFNGELIEMGEKINQTKQSTFESYENHNFLFRVITNSQQLKNTDIRFKKSHYDEKVEIYCNEELQEVEIFVSSPYDTLYSTVESALESCSKFITSIDDDNLNSNHLTGCLTPHLFPEYSEVIEEGKLIQQYRDQLIERLRNYTCNDETLQTTEPIETNTEIILDQEYQVDSHLLRDEAQIFVVHNFVTDNECNILMKSAEPRLERAVVVGADGGAVVSESRRAQQASYNLRSPTDPLWNLYHRILNFTNSHTNYNLKPEGQEFFTVIQYNKSDEYTPHCDGSCDGEPHISTGRVATAVLYCQIPEIGGATTFTKADVFIRPKKGMATFFTYMAPDGTMDSGYTEHSGCPVKVGQKWIATAWMREGVTEVFNSEKFEPSGKRIFDKEFFENQVVEIEQDALF